MAETRADTLPPDIDWNAVRTRLADALAARNLSQRALCRAAATDQGNLSRFMAGKRAALEAETIDRISVALAVPLETLLEGDPSDDAATAPEPAAPGRAPEVIGVDMGAGELARLRLDQIVASPDNPRRTFDEEALAELAESIAVDGVLQNLIVRRHYSTDDGMEAVIEVDGEELPVYQLVAGERRLRALCRLADEGRWPRDAARIPCRIVAADAVAARVLAIVENLQRADVPPLEEAEAFKALRELDPKTWSAPKIAARIGRTERYVQQRLALLEKLEPAVKDALAEGRIDLTRARILSGVTRERQGELLDDIEHGRYGVHNETSLRSTARQGLIPIDRAIFDVERYGGGIHTDDEGNRFFADRKEFRTAQHAAAKAEAARLQRELGWANFVEGYVQWSGYRKAEDGDAPETVGAIVQLWANNGEVEIREGLVAVSEANGEDDARRERRQQEIQASVRRQEARQGVEASIRERLTTDPQTAMRLAILSFIAHWQDEPPTTIRVQDLHGRHAVAIAGPLAPIATLAASDDEDGDEDDDAGLCLHEDAGLGWAWAILEGMDDEAVDHLLTALIADCFGDYRHMDELHPIAHGLALKYGIAIPAELLPEQADIEDAVAAAGGTDAGAEDAA